VVKVFGNGAVDRAIVILLLTLVSGCASIGHKTINTDQYNYNLAINKGLNEQMLLNLVQMRYGDSPMFLRISNVVNSYSIEEQVSAVGSFSFGGDDNELSVTPFLKYTDRPTITYVPLTGTEFAESILTPISDSVILSFINMGWSAEWVLRLCLRSINGITNRVVNTDGSLQFDSRFVELAKLFRRLQLASALDTWSRQVEDNTSKFLSFSNSENEPSVEADIARVRELLGLDPEIEAYSIGLTRDEEHHSEIKVYGRSLHEILTTIASEINFPAGDVEKKVVPATPNFSEFGEDEPGPFINVHASPEKPSGAFIAIRYRSAWFWIDDSDYTSKKRFSILMGLFTVTESGTGDFAPILTIPAG